MSENIIYRSPKSKLDWEKYYELRWRILRKPWGRPRGSEVNDKDGAAFHILAEQGDRAIGVGCIHEIEDGVGRIRFMAVDDDFQKFGIGRDIVRLLEDYAKENNWKTVRLWARESAINFYEKLNYKIIGDGELLFDVIKHKIMEKEITA